MTDLDMAYAMLVDAARQVDDPRIAAIIAILDGADELDPFRGMP